MNLGELIEFLEARDPEKVCHFGFENPHSYRGYYDQLAFEPATDVTIGDMLKAAKSALGTTYTGWKGGDFTMDQYTTVHLAQLGCTGDELGKYLLTFMVGEQPEAE